MCEVRVKGEECDDVWGEGQGRGVMMCEVRVKGEESDDV